MDERVTAQRWGQVEALLDAALTLPPDARAAFLAREAGGDESLLQDVQALLEASQTRGDVFDRPAAALLREYVVPGLAAGTRIGAYRLLVLVGRGGMGEVYRAERADGQFQQQVALKLIRREAVDQLERFQDERRLLARLDHPGIARLFDGGVADDGRPYMVMEWVDGLAITDWCAEHRSRLAQRLEIFLQVCTAVAYAHRNLLVHRDLKPDNVLVNAEGQAKLLDFGVAKLLSGADLAQQTQAPITPAYAAPEQLAQAPVTTSADVYALGLLLFELLTGERPFHRPKMSLAQLIEKQTREAPPAASAVAARLRAPLVDARLLRGDLDAIIAKALRKEPEHRYETVAALEADLQRYRRGEPVAARRNIRGYVFGRFLRRYRWSVAGVAAVIASLAVGLAGTYWQAQRATAQAHRAQAVQGFLVDVFRASDPRIAADKPRGQITARELLDLNAPRIAQEFGAEPETEIALLGVVASIYRELGDEARYQALHRQQTDVARSRYGEAHPAIIEGLIDDAEHANDRNDYAEALKLLTQADPLIRRADLDRSATRARWYLVRSNVESEDKAAQEQAHAALEKAAALYAEVAPTDSGYVKALTDLGWHYRRDDLKLSVRYFEQAVAAAEAAGPHGRNDAQLQQFTYPGLAATRESLSNYAGAEQAYERSAELARKTYGDDHSNSWVSAAEYAAFVHRQGERARAHALFDALMQRMPADWTTDSYDEYAREFYATCLIAEGRAGDAIPLLEHARRTYIDKPSVEYEQRRNSLILGDAYDRAGRTEEARAMIKSSLDERLARDPPASPTIRTARERWGRFLLEHGDLAGAEEQFKAIMAADDGGKYAGFALTRSDLARLALARRDLATAQAEIGKAIDIFDHITARRDVRLGPQLWLTRAQVLLAAGDRAGAHEWAARALEASQKYDDPAAPSIAEARAALRAAEN